MSMRAHVNRQLRHSCSTASMKLRLGAGRPCVGFNPVNSIDTDMHMFTSRRTYKASTAESGFCSLLQLAISSSAHRKTCTVLSIGNSQRTGSVGHSTAAISSRQARFNRHSAAASMEDMSDVVFPEENTAMFSTGLLIVYAIVAYYAWKLWKLVRADADLRLLSKRPVEADALKGKVVWLVGASQGLGQELASSFASYGADLILSARNSARLEALQQQLNSRQPGTAAVLPLDVTWPHDQLIASAQLAEQAFPGGIDYLVYATGASQHARVEETSSQVVEQMLARNTTGAVHLARAVLPHMLQKRSGRFVLVSSMAACVPSPGQSTYALCKAGLNAYFETLATELADRGVGASICCPGPIVSQEGVTRNVYGPQGLMSTPAAANRHSNKHMAQSRVAELIVRAAVRKVDKCWIAKHPVLLMGYINQYFPKLGMEIMKQVGPGRAAQLEKGGSGYNVTTMIKRAFKASKTL